MEENARFFETTRSRRPISTFLVRNSERERDPFIYTRVGIRRAATRFILYHIERGEGGKDCVNDDERKRESEREKKRDF